MVSQKQYTEDPAAEAEFDRIANSILSDILAANPWLQRFCAGAVRFLSPNSHKAKNLNERYPFFPGLNLMALNPHVRICSHIMVTGIRCGSPALREHQLCYFHQRMIRGVPTPKRSRIHPMALLENPESIQVALMETINAIVRNQIDLHRAELIIKALHIAVKNSREANFRPYPNDVIRQLPESQPDEMIAVPPELPAPAPATVVPAYLPPFQGWDLPKSPAQPPRAKLAVPRKPPSSVTSVTMKEAGS